MKKLEINLSNKVLRLRWLGVSGWENVPVGLFERGKRLFFSDGVDVWEVVDIKSGYPNMVCFGIGFLPARPTSLSEEFWLLTHEIQFQEIQLDIPEGLYKLEESVLLLNDGSRVYYVKKLEVDIL